MACLVLDSATSYDTKCATESTVFIQSFEGRLEQKARLHPGAEVHILNNDTA